MFDSPKEKNRVSYNLLHQECTTMHSIRSVYQNLVVLLVLVFFFGIIISASFFPTTYLWNAMMLSQLGEWNYNGQPNLISPIFFDGMFISMAIIDIYIAYTLLKTQCQHPIFRISSGFWLIFAFSCFLVVIPQNISIHGIGGFFFYIALGALVLSLYDPRLNPLTAFFFIMLLIVLGIFFGLLLSGSSFLFIWQKIYLFTGFFAILVHPFIMKDIKEGE